MALTKLQKVNLGFIAKKSVASIRVSVIHFIVTIASNYTQGGKLLNYKYQNSKY